MSFSSRAAAIRKRSSPKWQVIFAFVFSRIGDFFRIVGIDIFKVTASLRFLRVTARAAVDNRALRLSPLYYDSGQQVAHSGGLTRSPLYDASSRCGLSRVSRVFHHAQRPPPVERAPAYYYNDIQWAYMTLCNVKRR